MQAARGNKDFRASVNKGKPSVAATPKAGDFKGHGVVKASEAGAPYTPRAEQNNAARTDNHDQNNGGRAGNVVHPKDIPAAERPAAPNTGNAKQDKKYQQQQEKLYAQQDKERQKLQQQQDKEHEQMAKQKADDAKQQQVEQKHAQQTQQLQQRHTQQIQQMQQRQAPRSPSRPPR